MLKQLNKIWEELPQELIFLSKYTLAKPRIYISETSECKVIIELQDSKYSTKNNKEVAVNILVGLKWKNPIINHHEGWNYQQCRLSEDCIQDKWWKINNEADIERLRNDLVERLNSVGKSFIDTCSTHAGAFEWIKEHEIPTVTMLYAEEIIGKDGLKQMIINWLKTYNRGTHLNDFFDWLESTECFPKGEMETMKRKSWQTTEAYKKHVDEWVEQQNHEG